MQPFFAANEASAGSDDLDEVAASLIDEETKAMPALDRPVLILPALSLQRARSGVTPHCVLGSINSQEARINQSAEGRHDQEVQGPKTYRVKERNALKPFHMDKGGFTTSPELLEKTDSLDPDLAELDKYLNDRA
ncbi:uncharacterized protein IUM83_06669 [Phytophthora cinnamomi]|uniref:uncharacterized protein n=1 Tax=Phytophthora cinnamomi TaxID=4785 RepID=UPI003559C313|nr:hypothetical protein IUM83_06669 [Phytophthora cinnamomi]